MILVPVMKRQLFTKRIMNIDLDSNLGMEVIEELPQLICNVSSNVKFNGKKLKITLTGAYEDVKRCQKIIKTFQHSIKASSRPNLKGTRYITSTIIEKRLGRKISMKIIHDALRLKGYATELKEEGILTNADLYEILKIGEKIVTTRIHLEKEPRSVKRYVAIASYITGLDIFEVIQVSKYLNILVSKEGKLKITKNINDSLRILVEDVKSEHKDNKD